MNYKILLFDLDNTLLDFSANEKQALNKVFEYFNVEVTETITQAYHQVNKALWERYERSEIDLQEVLHTRFSKTMLTIGKEINGEEWEKVYRIHLGEGAQILEGAYEVCEQLAKTHRLFIATNGVTETQLKRLEKSGLIHYFEGIFTSQDIGHQKPSTHFFDYMKSNIKDFKEEEALMIGDTYGSDIVGGNNAGIHTCWLTNETSIENKKSTYRIVTIKELLNIL